MSKSSSSTSSTGLDKIGSLDANMQLNSGPYEDLHKKTKGS